MPPSLGRKLVVSKGKLAFGIQKNGLTKGIILGKISYIKFVLGIVLLVSYIMARKLIANVNTRVKLSP